MRLFWMEAILVVVLTCLAASAVIMLLWRRRGIQRLEVALLELQHELTRINSLLEETRSRIVHAAIEDEAQTATNAGREATAKNDECRMTNDE